MGTPPESRPPRPKVGDFSVLVGGARSAPKGRRRRPKGAAQRREAPPEAAKQGREKRAIFKSGLLPGFRFHRS